MSDNKIFDFCLERLQKDDWLGLSNLYFDNAYVINVFSTRGYVAYSPSKMCFFTMGTLDSTDSELVEGTYAVLEHGILGLQQNITAVSYEHLQHFDMAQYCHYQFYTDEQEVMPWARIPSRATIMGLTHDPNTGLYTGENLDEVQLASNYPGERQTSTRWISSIGFFPEEEGEQQQKNPNKWYYSGARIAGWQRFYKNQEKFKTMLNSAFGVSDAI